MQQRESFKRSRKVFSSPFFCCIRSPFRQPRNENGIREKSGRPIFPFFLSPFLQCSFLLGLAPSSRIMKKTKRGKRRCGSRRNGVNGVNNGPLMKGNDSGYIYYTTQPMQRATLGCTNRVKGIISRGHAFAALTSEQDLTTL